LVVGIFPTNFSAEGGGIASLGDAAVITGFWLCDAVMFEGKAMIGILHMNTV
jgi:hypothetical protein